MLAGLFKLSGIEELNHVGERFCESGPLGRREALATYRVYEEDIDDLLAAQAWAACGTFRGPGRSGPGRLGRRVGKGIDAPLFDIQAEGGE